MKNIVLIAPPAAGKGTQSELLVEKYGYTHISSGDLLRSVNQDTPVGKEIFATMKNGDLVSDELVFGLIKEKLLTFDYKQGVIFDGMPRTLNQVELYNKLCQELGMESGHIMFINISEEKAMRRSLGRLGCPNCGKIYNKNTNKPKLENVCDECSTSLVSRDDDNEETFKARFSTYLKNVEPVVEYYRNLGTLITVEAHDNKMDTFAQIEKVLGND